MHDIAPFAVTLSDLHVHSPIASFFSISGREIYRTAVQGQRQSHTMNC